MNQKIPSSAFEYYVALGPGRSYRAVGERFGVSKRAVTKHAAREKWSARLAKVEAEAREKSDQRSVDGLQEMNERHLKIAKALQSKAIEGLRDMPLDSAKDIIRALDLGVRQERLVRGEPTERQASVEEVTRQEIRELLVVDDDVDGDAEAATG